MAKFKKWITDVSNRDKFKSDVEKNALQRILVQLHDCCVRIGASGVHRMSYGFTAQVNKYICIHKFPKETKL